MSGQGIDNFMKKQTLFTSPIRSEYGRRLNDSNASGKAGSSKRHHYHLLNLSSNKNDQSSEVKEKARDDTLDKAQKEEALSESRQTQRGQKNQQVPSVQTPSKKIQRQKRKFNSTQDNPIEQEESPTKWEAIVIKSSRKYFDSCRIEALEYIAKLQDILNKDHQFLNLSLGHIHSKIEEAHSEMAESIKENFYRIIDEAVQRWKAQSLERYKGLQISHIGELYELNTQIDERYKQIVKFKDELDSQKFWKSRASDLLTSTYEADFIQLSKLCKKSVQLAEGNVKRYWEAAKKDLDSKFVDRNILQDFRVKVQTIITQNCFNQEQKNKSPPPKSIPYTENSKELDVSNYESFGNSQDRKNKEDNQ